MLIVKIRFIAKLPLRLSLVINALFIHQVCSAVRDATANSLVIIDEFGKGTCSVSTEDAVFR